MVEPVPIGDADVLTHADLDDALRALEVAERRARRHLLWVLLGISPAALIPFVGLLTEGSFGLVIVLLVLVFLVEGWRYLAASKEAGRLRAVVQRLEAQHRDALPEPEGGSASPPSSPGGRHEPLEEHST